MGHSGLGAGGHEQGRSGGVPAEAGDAGDRLGADLHFVGPERLGFAALVFNWEYRAVGVEFDHIALARETEFERTHCHAAGDADSGAGFS